MPLTFSAPRRPPVPRWAKGAAIAFALLGGGVGLLAMMVDFSGAAKTAIANATKENSGFSIKAGGKTVSHFFPPGATMKDVTIQAGGLNLSGTDMTLVFSWGALFGDAEPSEIIFEHGSAVLTRTDKAPPPPPATITFKSVRLPALEQQGEEKPTPSSLDLTLRPEVPGGTASKNYITGGWSANGVAWQVNGQFERWFGVEPAPYSLTFTSSGTQVAFKGQAQVDDKGWGWEGEGDIQSKGIWTSLKGASRFWAHRGMEALPQADMSLKGHYTIHGGHMKLEEWQWASGNDKGSLNLELQPEGAALENGDIPQSGTMQAHFEHLTLDGWAPLFNQPKTSGIALIMRALQQGAKTKISDAETAEYYSGTHSMLPNNVRLNVEMEVATLSLNGQSLPGLSAQGELADAVFTLNQVQAGLPGDGRLTFSGVLKPTQDAWQLNGAVDVNSQSFRQVAAWLGEKLDAVPEAMLGSYSMKANIAIEPGQVRLTEIEGTLDKSQYRGAFIFHLPETETERLKLEASWVADHVNLDEYLPPEDWSGIGADDVAAGGPMPAWLKAIASDMAMQCRIGELTWRGIAWGDSQARFTMMPGALDVSLFRTNPGGSPVQGKFTLTAQAIRPKLDLTLKADGPLDARQVQTLVAGKPREEAEDETPPVDEASWSESTIDTSWLSVLEGNLDLFMSRFNVRHLGAIDNLRMKGSIANRVLTVEAAQADMLGGKVAVKGQLAGGSLPSLSASFQTLGIRVVDLLKLKLNTVHVDGALSMQGNVRTQGISPASWVAGLTSNIRFAVENLRIDGFDLDAIGRRVLVTRSAIDVSNLARLALEDGSSSIRRLDGNMAVQQGIAEFVVVNLSTDAIGGSLQGKTDLPRMLTNIRFTFTPQTTRDDPPPAIHFDVKGPLLSPEKQLETSDLEAYIARQSVKSVE